LKYIPSPAGVWGLTCHAADRNAPLSYCLTEETLDKWFSTWVSRNTVSYAILPQGFSESVEVIINLN